jgi:hypothetical protein
MSMAVPNSYNLVKRVTIHKIIKETYKCIDYEQTYYSNFFDSIKKVMDNNKNKLFDIIFLIGSTNDNRSKKGKDIRLSVISKKNKFMESNEIYNYMRTHFVYLGPILDDYFQQIYKMRKLKLMQKLSIDSEYGINGEITKKRKEIKRFVRNYKYIKDSVYDYGIIKPEINISHQLNEMIMKDGHNKFDIHLLKDNYRLSKYSIITYQFQIIIKDN